MLSNKKQKMTETLTTTGDVAIETNPAIESSTLSLTESDWRQHSYILKERVTTPLFEAYKLASFGKETALLNFTNTPLTREELKEITDALSAVAVFSGGKIFDRIFGIVLAPRESFIHKPGSLPTAGDFNHAEPIVMINIDDMRRDASEEYLHFLANKFPDWKKISPIQYVIAHECGHALDLGRVSEVDRHGINKDSANPNWSAFGDITKSFCAFKDVEKPDSKEHRPSLRAENGPEEDFAEAFAQLALGRRAEDLPSRYRIIVKTISKARGESVIGPHKVEATKVA